MGMLRLSKQSDYATLLMSHLAADPEAIRSVGELAQATRLSAPMVSKTLKQLARGGLIESTRGAGGGYRLSRAAEQITVADIVRAVEGPIAMTECAGTDSHCAIESHCLLRPHWQVINATIIKSLSQLSLADLSRPAHILSKNTEGTMHGHRHH